MGKTVTIEIKGIDKIVTDCETIARTQRLEQTIAKCTAIVETTAKTLCPNNKYQHSTMPLRNTIHMNCSNYGNEIVGRVYTNSDHAIYVEFGTGQKGGNHPKSAELGYTYRTTPWVYTPDDGEHFYRTTGMVARPYMYPALKRNEQKISKMIEDAIRNEI